MAGLFGMIGGVAGLAGKKPKVPTPAYVDPQKAQETAVKGNISILPSVEKLIGEMNAYQTGQIKSGMESLVPGVMANMSKASSVTGEMLAGKLPKDVEDYISRKGAEAGVKSGTAGSQFAQAKTLRDLGLNSLQMKSAGMSAAERWAGIARSMTPTYDFGSMMITPGQQISSQQWNETNRYQQQTTANMIAAMPSPAQNSIMQGLDQLDNIGMMALSMYMGGGMGGGMGGMSGMGGKGSSSGYISPAPNYGNAFASGASMGFGGLGSAGFNAF